MNEAFKTQTMTSTTTRSITKTKMLIATAALVAAAGLAFLATPKLRTSVSGTTATSSPTIVEYGLITALLNIIGL